MNIQGLIYFYTEDCELCQEMEPEIKKIEEKYGGELMKINVEEGEDEKILFEELAMDECGGVPFLYNQDNNKSLCGFVTHKQIEKILE